MIKSLKSFNNKFIVYWLLLPISTFLYSGMFLWIFGKKGSGAGTVTSVFTTLILVALYSLHISLFTVIIAAIITSVLGVLTIENAELFMKIKWGKRKRHTGEVVGYDFNETTIDETAGILISAIPIYAIESIFGIKIDFGYFLFLQLISLAAFRIFDSYKLGLVKWVEDNMNKQSSITIVMDDIVAGVYAMIITMIVAGLSSLIIPATWIIK